MDEQIEPTIRKIETSIEGFFWILPNIGIALVVFAGFVAAAWGARRGVDQLLRRRGRENLGELLAGFTRWLIITLGVLVAMTIIFPSVKPVDLLSTLGIGSVAIGFAFKDILQNWLAGMLILFRQPFRSGDQIVVGTYEGTVETVEARATLIRTYDGRRVVIPNSDIYTGAVIVNTAFAHRRSEYDVGIGYGDDVERACQVMLDALRGLEGVEREPAADAIPWELDSSTVNIKLRWWTDSKRASVVEVRGRVIRAVKNAVVEAAIDLPFPTRVVLLHDQTEATDGDRTRQREGWPAGADPPAPRHLDAVSLSRPRPNGEAGASGADG